jgi:DNA-binding XRE family transcriptional regulator
MEVDYIKEARFKLRMTQEQLAQSVGCTRQTIHALESGKQECKLTMRLAIECLLRQANLHPVK